MMHSNATKESARDGLGIGAARRDFAPWADPQATPLIRFEGVTKRFGSTLAVDAVSLDIYERELFCLLGPSGCGKTTLLRMLAGFETSDEGRVLLGDTDLAGVPPHRRPVNMMFQSYALFPHMTVERNVGFGLRQEGRPRDEIAARVAEMLRLVRLEGLAGRRPDQLSGGERQRVALARALVKRPKVLLLDEPLAALDKKLRAETQFELMHLQVELGATFVVVTHDQDEAMTMADRIAVMDHGRIAQVATPQMLYERPATRAVAEFVGDVNLFEGRVIASGNGRLQVAVEAMAPLVVTAEAALTPGAPVAIALRPEQIVLYEGEAPEDATNLLGGRVWDIGYLGDSTIFRVKLENGQIVRVSRANDRSIAQPGRALTWDDPVHVSFAPDAAVVLTR